MPKTIKRPGKGAHAKELVRYAESLGYVKINHRNGSHGMWQKDEKRVPIPFSTKQPIATGTIFKILRDLESQ